MTERVQESSQKRIWIDVFDEEDWRQLFRNEFLGEYEDGKSFLRVN